jgi:bifunctional non-homologous end joining protein LigD
MPLQEYRKKRNFTKSSEPAGKRVRARQERGPLHFVVQRHQSHHLHYDLRLELNGVLKSWAIPKGLTLDPEQKKLAIMVEDHPLDYLTFEGVIPKGSYGAGTTIIWDEGEYHWAGVTGRRESEKAMNEGLEKGHISFVLKGRKLNGEFALVRLKRAKENNWLLIKKRDEFSHPEPPPAETRNKPAELSKNKVRHTRKSSKAASVPDITVVNLGDVPVTDKLPKISPMLATLIEKPFDREGWFFEIKWDGYRAIAEVVKNSVRLYSRNGNTLSNKFPALIHSLEKLPFDAVLDGEVVALDSDGRASFQLLQNHLRTGDGMLAYYVFDVLYLNGHDLRNIPLRRRKHILSQILKNLPNIRVSEFVEEKGISFFRAVRENGVEGIVAKNGKSIYQPGVRSREWLKIKNTQSQEAVIGGYTAPRGGRKHLGSLLLGVYEDHNLVYIGRSGGGFTEDELSRVHAKLAPLKKKTSPFKSPPGTDTPATWVKPELVCEVRFSDWTDDGLMRQPVFLGLREDISPFDVRREKPEKEIAAGIHPFNMPGDRTRIVIDGRELNLTNLEKIFWPDEGYTKGDVINYYREIAPVILPYLKDRPETMHRFPDGIAGQSFFQKNVDDKIAPWIETVTFFSESKEKEIRYLLCQNEASLVYMANLGCIEFHTWNSRYRSPDNPDYLVLDIDPLEVDFHYAVEVALATREVIERAGAKGFCKTSGATGLHIYIPMGAKYTTEQVQQFAQLINLLVHDRLPKTTSLERLPGKRHGKIYLDYLQNHRGSTMAAPYCLRPRKGAPVSAPLHWEELNEDLNPAHFHIKNMVKRIHKEGDIWQGFLRSGVDMEACLKRLSSTISPMSSRT